MAAVVLRDLKKRFGGAEVIKGIDLEIAAGEFVVVVGPSGCGKSTLLRLIAGLEDISDGKLLIDGEVVNDLPPAERGIAMVFQSYALYPHMNVYKNMAFGLSQAKFARKEIDQRVRGAAERLRIGELLDRKPKALSGGQRQRVAIGRAIVRNPKLFLFDEPLSNLDAALRVEMRIEIAKLQKELRATTLYVTHDQVEAMTLADRIAVLNDGRVEQVGSPLELYRRPNTLFVARFIGSPAMNLIPGKARSAGDVIEIRFDGGALLRLPCEAEISGTEEAITLGVRPEDLQLSTDNDAPAAALALPGELEAVEQLGAETLVHLRLHPDTLVTLRSDRAFDAKVGDRMTLLLRPEACHLFDSAGKALHHPAG